MFSTSHPVKKWKSSVSTSTARTAIEPKRRMHLTSHFRLARQSAAGGEHDESSHHFGVQLPKPHCAPRKVRQVLVGFKHPSSLWGLPKARPFQKMPCHGAPQGQWLEGLATRRPARLARLGIACKLYKARCFSKRVHVLRLCMTQNIGIPLGWEWRGCRLPPQLKMS